LGSDNINGRVAQFLFMLIVVDILNDYAMKTTSMIILMLAVSMVLYGQQQTPATNSSIGSPVQQANPSTSQPNQPVIQSEGNTATPTGTSRSNDPFLSPQSQPTSGQQQDPIGEQQQRSTAQPGSDYHLTQPATSPVGAQIGTQNGTQSSDTPIPYNQQPGTMMRVEREQLPGVMIETLQDPKYEGWENTTIYYNGGTHEYSFDIGSETEIKNFRFDRDGNPVQQPALEDQQ
jgi:hypothetical protein